MYLYIFVYIFVFRQCWEQLVWLDTANFGGIKGKLPDETQNDSNDDNEDEDEDEVKIVVTIHSF